MSERPIQIRNPEVVADIRRLAGMAGLPLTEAVAGAVRAQLEQAERREKSARERRLRRVAQLRKELQKLPKVGRRLTDRDLYDDSGMPR